MVFFFGILTYLILQREKNIILDFYKEKALQTANIIAMQMADIMLTEDPNAVTKRIREFSTPEDVKIGVAGPTGLPTFETDIAIPEEIFAAQRETHVESNDELAFFKPLKNESRCHRCHDPEDKTRGMIVIKTSMKKAQVEVNETTKRLISFSVLIGIVSEIFLIIILRRMILNPIAVLNKGAEILKSGNLSYRIKLRRDDEIGELASCFNEMADNIERSHTNLEEAVRQRTKELRVIAELSLKVFKGDLTLKEIIENFIEAITDRMGYRYSALCLIDKETGLLLTEFKRGMDAGFCDIEISLASDHPFIKTIREATPAIKVASDIGLPEVFGNVAMIPILSHQRRRCREINLCTFENCPAFNNPDERCWLISDTLCRSPQAVAGKDKIYGCLHCNVFPVLGVLIAGKKEEIIKTSLHSLEILASEMASAIENQKLIDGKKEDINHLIKLHDISVETIRDLDMHALTQSIVSSATIFSNMDAAILWLKGINGRLYFENASNIEKEIIPETIPIDVSFAGKAIIEARTIETVKIHDEGWLNNLVRKHEFLYMAAVPLKLKETIYGCLMLFKKKDFFMTATEMAIIQLYAGQAAAAINTAQIYGELKAEKEFSDAILGNMSMGVMVLNREGNIVRANPAAFNILKVNDYIIGRNLNEIMPQASDFLVIGSAIGREIDVAIGTDTVPIGFNNSPLFDASGKQTGIVVVFRDLTEIKKLQAEIRKKQHFEAMGRVVAGVAHEIRNPLFGISSIVQILKREIDSEQQRPLLDAILKEIYRLKNLVEELLLYSRPSKLNIVDIEFSVLMDKIMHYIRAKKNSVILNMTAKSLTSLRADIDRLTQILLNIIDNSIGAGSKNINITAENRNNSTVLTIKDDGIGIKKEAMERIFEPFFTTKKEGTGLGLAICKKIIEDHGGNIEIQSTEGGGTTVILTLPL